MKDLYARSGKIKIFNTSTGKIEESEKVYKSEVEWEKILTPEQFKVMRLKGTEAPDLKRCDLPKESGIYQCVGCKLDLFAVNTKFDSKTGWPSFWQPVSELNIRIETDNSFGMQRVEVLCARCDAHLGHVFDDGPPPTGKRYCINAVALKFVKKNKVEKAAFAAGCFWGTEAAFSEVKGVIKATSGYMGGKTKNPTYEDVSSGKTGHAETVLVEYDPKQITYDELLGIFWSIHDPTTMNRQGSDVGSQYRSVIFYFNPEQMKVAELSRESLNKSGKLKSRVVTEIVPAGDFYKAEEYHQGYFEKRGIKPTCHIPLKNR